MKKSILVIAGEVSGDMYAAKLLRRLKERQPDIEFWGIGGEQLRSCGAEIIYDVQEMGVVGVWEVIQRYGFFKRVFKDILEKTRQRQPDAVLLIDYPGFNLRFAAQAHKLGLKVIYYICPQVWAWHRSRIEKMAKIIDRLMVIFPFEVDVFKHTNLRVDFVGHPLVEETQKVLTTENITLPWTNSKHVALLPGSRQQEVQKILPIILRTADILSHEHQDLSFIIAAPSQKISETVRNTLANSTCNTDNIKVVVGKTRHILKQANCALVASGTATIETALMNCPMLVIYRTATFTYWLGRMLIKVPHLGMVNLVAGYELCPEFLQNAAQPAEMAAALIPLLEDGHEHKTMKNGLVEVAKALSSPSTHNAVDVVLSEISD